MEQTKTREGFFRAGTLRKLGGIAALTGMLTTCAENGPVLCRQDVARDATYQADQELLPVGFNKEKSVLRITTLNAARGQWGWGAIADSLQAQDSDIICLQEATREGIDQVKKSVGMERVAAGWSRPGLGNAVLTSLPMTDTRHYILNEESSKPRGLVTASVRTPDRDVVVAVTHLTSNEASDAEGNAIRREQQAGTIMDILARDYAGTPVILCGDFNTRAGGRVHDTFSRTLDDVAQKLGAGEVPTFPGLDAHIDFIMYGRDDWRAVSWRLGSVATSDHCAVTAELAPAPALVWA